MNELEQAFDELAVEEDEKLTEKLSGETKATVEQDDSDKEQEEEIKDKEAELNEKTSPRMPVLRGGLSGGIGWEQQLREISEFTGEGVYGLEGLRKLPNFEKMHKLMSVGATALEAYKVVNFDNIMRTEVQKERNKLRGKAHLKASGGGADANEVVVPNDVYRAFKMLEPKMSDEEIRQYYKKTRTE